jgi:uncharacterized damage-inducible protein DinB
MPIKEALLPEYDLEMKTTRRVLERVPMADAQWKPHDKSMSLGRLATHISEIPGWIGSILNASELDLGATSDYKPATLQNSEELLSAFDANVAKTRAFIASKSDADLMEIWTLKSGGKAVMSIPKAGVLRSLLMNHLIHHRGQLSVYLRLRNVPVPSIYGPSADEAPHYY